MIFDNVGGKREPSFNSKLFYEVLIITSKAILLNDVVLEIKLDMNFRGSIIIQTIVGRRNPLHCHGMLAKIFRAHPLQTPLRAPKKLKTKMSNHFVFYSKILVEAATHSHMHTVSHVHFKYLVPIQEL